MILRAIFLVKNYLSDINHIPFWIYYLVYMHALSSPGTQDHIIQGFFNFCFINTGNKLVNDSFKAQYPLCGPKVSVNSVNFFLAAQNFDNFMVHSS